jgi:hypothetical protein
MNIDWGSAPDWAIAHAFHATAMGVKEVWVGEDKYQQFDHGKSFPYGGTVGAMSYHNPRRYQFAFETQRPTRWTGEGLPPVGTVCEILTIRDAWAKVFVVAITDYRIYCETVGRDEPDEFCPIKKYARFRPILTPEQIADEAREAQAKELFQLINPDSKWHKCDHEPWIAAIDAGWQKVTK